MIQYKIPVMRPTLPKAEDILPYLKEIDENRWYSNFGPLNSRLEGKIAKHFKVSPEEVGTFSNATSALSIVMRGLNIPRGSYCAVPSWTFVATAGGTYNADLIPFFVDVNETTQAVEPENLLQIKERITAVIVVAPFGAPLNIKKWQDFKNKYGIEVIIDAAAAFDSLANSAEFAASDIPIIVSMHATKAFASGEGGFVICKNKDFIFKIKKLSNFGFTPEGIIFRGSNAKLSEYSAAVGLAQFDRWEEKRKAYTELTEKYLQHFKKLGISTNLDKNNVTTVCNAHLPKANVDEAMKYFDSKAIETRRWWKKGCHNFAPYADFPKTPLFNTDKLVNTALGIPFWLGLKDAEIEEVMSVLKEVI